jgi:hypothetical protein
MTIAAVWRLRPKHWVVIKQWAVLGATDFFTVGVDGSRVGALPGAFVMRLARIKVSSAVRVGAVYGF